MQTIKSYLYPNPIHVLIYGSDEIGTEDRIVYSRGIKLYQGVTNQVKLLFLNQDQKSVDITDYTVQANIFDVNGNQVLVTSEAIQANIANVVNVSQLIFSSNDLDVLKLGQYEIALIATDPNSIVTTLYIDDNYGVRLPVDFSLGPVAGLKPPVNLNFTIDPDNGVSSQIVDLTAPQNVTNTLSIQANLVAYSGNVMIQGAMITTPVNTDFGNLTLTNYSNYSGPIMNTVTGSFSALRMVLDTANVYAPANTNVNSALLRF